MKFRFSRENAREFAKKGYEARLRNKALRDCEPCQIVSHPPKPSDTIDQWIDLQSMRVRGHVQRLHRLMDETDDPMAIDRLSRALDTLLDRARILAGVPLVKPQAAQRVKQTTTAEPL